MATTLLFRTAAGAVNIPAGTMKTLGTANVANSQQIRVVCDERIGSGTGVTIMLTITEGNELVAFLDTIVLAPHAQATRVYDVPGTLLTISAQANAGAGNASVDVLVYGH